MESLPNLGYKHLAVAIGFGAVSALVASWAELGLVLNSFPPQLLPGTGGQTPVMILTAVLIAPFVEELAKPLGLYILQAEERPELTLKEWAFLGAMAGLGFAIIENFMYAGSVGAAGTDAAAMLMLLRFLLPLHMMASSITGFGFGLWAKTRNAKYFIYCLFAAMLLHGLFNLAASFVG